MGSLLQRYRERFSRPEQGIEAYDVTPSWRIELELTILGISAVIIFAILIFALAGSKRF